MIQDRPIDALVREAAKNLDRGVIAEPRVYYNAWAPANTLLNVPRRSTAQAFMNGEQFPVRITHATVNSRSPLERELSPWPVDTNIFDWKIRFKHHDQAYPSGRPLLVPNLHNCNIGLAHFVNDSAVHYEFERPYVMTPRASLRIEWAAPGTLDFTEALFSTTVTLIGVGMYSFRPYVLSDSQSLVFYAQREASLIRGMFNPENLRNDGQEPIAITDLVFSTGVTDTVEARGNVPDYALQMPLSEIGLRIRAQGDNTGANWTTFPALESADAPVRPFPKEFVTARLLGKDGGRAVTHRFPGEGVTIEPGDEIIVEMTQLRELHPEAMVEVALLGYIEVK